MTAHAAKNNNALFHYQTVNTPYIGQCVVLISVRDMIENLNQALILPIETMENLTTTPYIIVVVFFSTVSIYVRYS